MRRFIQFGSFLLTLASVARADDHKSYPFAEAPVKALEKSAELQKVSGQKSTTSPDEWRLFRDAADGKLQRWSFADAALLASGVTDAARRKDYLAKIDALEMQAREATGGAKTAAEKGEALLKFVHSKVLAKKGYSAEQTDLHVLLDTGKFNCVSSAMIYNILAARVGLKGRFVELPAHNGHVFAVLHDGDQALEVETTTSYGFNPGRDHSQKAKYKELGIPYIGEIKNKDKREIGDFQLLAVIYANRVSVLHKKERYHEALTAALSACCLDRDSVLACNNTLAAISMWERALSKSGKFEDAVAVAVYGFKLGPTNETLRKIAEFAYGAWARSHYKSNWDEAIRIYDAGLKDMPGNKHLEQSRKYCLQERNRGK